MINMILMVVITMMTLSVTANDRVHALLPWEAAAAAAATRF